MIHYHGTPLTPRSELIKMAGRCFCVSYARPDDGDWCAKNAQSVMLDNGAFSLHTRGTASDWAGFYSWLEPYLGGANWAVVPDVIYGDVDDNLCLIDQWPHDKARACVVWHMGEPIDHLLRLTDMGFGRVAFGSSGKYWQVGSPWWERRCDAAFDALSKRGPIPWVHMLRGLSLCGGRWPFASADSTNIARNFKDTPICPEAMAKRIDAIQSPLTWTPRAKQMEFFNEAV